MKLSNELKVGALTAIAITVLILGFSFLKGVNLFTKTQKLYVLLEDASSVSPASPVAMFGIRIGKVMEVRQERNDNFNVIFNLSINKDVKVPKGSSVEIVELDLLGTKELRVTPGNSTSYLENGDTIVGVVKGGMMAVLEEQLDEKLGPLVKSAEPLLSSIDTLVNNVNGTLLENGSLESMLASLSRTLDNFEKISKNVDQLVANQDENIEEIIENANTLFATISNNSNKIDSIFTNFTTLSSKLSKLEFDALLENANTALDEIKKLMANLNESDGTLGKLLNEDGIYTVLDSTLNSLNALLVDVKANPKRYVSLSLIERKDRSGK